MDTKSYIPNKVSTRGPKKGETSVDNVLCAKGEKEHRGDREEQSRPNSKKLGGKLCVIQGGTQKKQKQKKQHEARGDVVLNPWEGTDTDKSPK